MTSDPLLMRDSSGRKLTLGFPLGFWALPSRSALSARLLCLKETTAQGMASLTVTLGSHLGLAT